MIIENFRKIVTAERVRVSATLIWENCRANPINPRPSQEVYFETTAEYGDDLHLNPNSWLLCSALAAMRYDEKRIKIDAPISSEIKDGLTNAMKCLINWYGGDNSSGILGDRQVISLGKKLKSFSYSKAIHYLSPKQDQLTWARDVECN